MTRRLDAVHRPVSRWTTVADRERTRADMLLLFGNQKLCKRNSLALAKTFSCTVRSGSMRAI